LGSTIENSTGFGISLDELSDEKEIKDILTFIANLIEKEEDLEQIKLDKESVEIVQQYAGIKAIAKFIP